MLVFFLRLILSFEIPCERKADREREKERENREREREPNVNQAKAKKEELHLVHLGPPVGERFQSNIYTILPSTSKNWMEIGAPRT